MSFSYKPMSEEESIKAREFPLLPEGIYDFVVTESKFGYSVSGNPMIKLKVCIHHEGKEFNVFDNLIGTDNMVWKTRHFCETTNLLAQFESGEFNETLCQGRRGVCKIKMVPERPKNDGSGTNYKAKNDIEDYISTDKLKDNPKGKVNPFTQKPQLSKSETEEFFNDSIPF